LALTHELPKCIINSTIIFLSSIRSTSIYGSSHLELGQRKHLLG
jgi:hypothetical protein